MRLISSIRESLRRLASAGGGREAEAVPEHRQRRRLTISVDPDVIYAIGDVHGCIGKLRALERAILADAADRPGSKLLVFLGDYVDRGPDSAGVIDHLLAPAPPGFHRMCLCGNHEAILAELFDAPAGVEDWLRLGGDRTLLSYGYDYHYMMGGRSPSPETIRDMLDVVPPDHAAFLRSLPVCLETPGFFFVHAGARPGVPLADQTQEDLLWIRDAFLNAAAPAWGKVVVHGHTPASAPTDAGWRIGVDTGAYMDGALTAARITRSGVGFLQAG